jgi:hypothetical protein
MSGGDGGYDTSGGDGSDGGYDMSGGDGGDY